MNLDDLRYSNSLYIYRAITETPMTVDEIASKLKMTSLTVSKIIKKLFSDNILDKYKNIKDKRCGRPNIYYGPGSYYFTVLFLCTEGRIDVYFITPSGNVEMKKGLCVTPRLGEETIIANTLRGHIGKDNPRSLGIYLIGEDLHKYGDVRFMTKLDVNELFAEAYSDEEKTIFIEHSFGKLLINHAKPRLVDISKEELLSILDIDYYHDFRGESLNDLIIRGMKKLSQKLLERKL